MGGPEADGGLRGDLGKCMKEEALEGELEEVLYWVKHIKGKALWRESDNELHQIEGC